MPGIKRLPLVIALAALFVAAPVYLLASGHNEMSGSSDAGAPPSPLLFQLAPLLAGLLLVWLLPPRTPSLASPPIRPARESWLLVGLAVAFPVAVAVLGWAGVETQSLYPVLKLLLFLAVPLTLLAIWKRSTPVDRPQWRGFWRWWMPLGAIAVWAYLAFVSPLRKPALNPADYPDLVTLTVIALITFVTASVLEEIFYRVMLQTRLEARFGPTVGILVSSVLFAVMHLPTHHPYGETLPDIAAAVANQGLMGLFLGSLWSRYRNVWVVIAVHAAANSVGLIPLYL